jgi:RimJ/RimL family protein N-acetyltransferase
MELDLGLCTLRPFRPEDAESIVRYANDRGVWLNLRDRFPHPYTPADAEKWLHLASTLPAGSQFAITVGDNVVGGIGLHMQEDVHRLSAEIGYWLGRPFWGRGIATAAVRAVTAHAFATFDLCRLYAMVFEWNPASRRVLEKAGYTLEGRLRRSIVKDGKIIDAFLYAAIRA